MRFNKRLFMFSIITVSLFCFICSCVKGEYVLRIKVSSSKITLNDLASKIYDDWKLQQVVEFEGNIDQLNDKYPIECIRKNDLGYRVSYLGNNKAAVILLDNSGNIISGVIYNTKRSKSDFDTLIKGQSLDEVRKIDPDGEYPFLYTGKNDTPKISSHYTNDGYLISIEYDDFNTVISISEELI